MLYSQKNKKKAFTLIEMMLVIAIMSLAIGFSAPIYQSFQVKNSLEVEANIISQSLKRAQILSMAVDSDSSWGVYIANGEVIIFKGGSYATRDSSFDEIFEVSENINPSGLSEITYSKFLGEPQSTGDIILTNSNSETKILNVNNKGTVEY